MNVAVIGASNKPERYSYLAVKNLIEKGHKVFPIHPALDEVLGIKVYPSVKDIKESIDTITLYISPEASNSITEDIIKINPKRIIFNPGAENRSLLETAKNNGIDVIEACTLVMLKTGSF
jgi:uncharacterized protein